jgi:hypothetical protein
MHGTIKKILHPVPNVFFNPAFQYMKTLHSLISNTLLMLEITFVYSI